MYISFGPQQVVVDHRAFFNEIRGVGTLDLNNWRCRNCVLLRPMAL